MTRKYTLDGHTPVQVDDLFAWARWFETADRSVARDERGDSTVETYFLGLDYGDGVHAPMVFETTVSGGEHHGHQVRCATWEMAEECHRRALALVDTPPRTDGAGGDAPEGRG